MLEGETSDSSGLLVLRHLIDTPHVALVTRKGGPQKRVDEQQCLVDAVLPRTDGANIGIVVLTGKNRSVHIPYQRRPRTVNFVRRHLLTISRATEDNAEGFHAGFLVSDNTPRGADAEARVVIQRIKRFWTVVDNLMTFEFQMVCQIATELEAGMVSGNVNAHDLSL